MARINKKIAALFFKKARELSVNDEFLWFFRKDLADYVKINPVPLKEDKFFRYPVFSFKAVSLSAAAIAVTLFIILGGSIGVWASSKSAPGNFLYPVKIAGEKLRATFMSDGKPKADFRIKQANTRINEIKDLRKKSAQTLNEAEKKNDSLIKETTSRLNSHIEDALEQRRLLKKRNKSEEASEINEKLKTSLEFYKKTLEQEKEETEPRKNGQSDFNNKEIDKIIKDAEDFKAKEAEEQEKVEEIKLPKENESKIDDNKGKNEQKEPEKNDKENNRQGENSGKN